MTHENNVQQWKGMYMYVFCLFLYHISSILAALTDQDLHLPDKESQFENRSKPFLEFIISIFLFFTYYNTYLQY
mgnify:CR=1 FL=1